MPSQTNYIDTLHNLIDDEYEARACKDIDDNACKVVPGNYLLLTVSLVLSKMADTLASAKILLPWLMASTGAPIFLISLLVPIREAGSMLPQLWLGAYIRKQPVRKRFLVWGALLQMVAIAALLPVAMSLKGTAAGVVIIGLTILFSLARALSSIANKDVTGKTIPKKQRGRLSGTAASIAGFFSIGFGVLLLQGLLDTSGASYLLAFSALCFGLSAISYGVIKEFAGASEGAVNAIQMAIKNLSLLHKDIDFACFVLVRVLMVSSGLAAPYFVIMMMGDPQEAGLQNLGLLIIVSGVASFISGGIWGRLADRNSKALMTTTSVITAAICLSGALVSSLVSVSSYVCLGLFFMLSVVHEGVRQGRKTYLVDMAKGNQRTDYVSVSNTVVGLLLLILGIISGVIAQYSITAVLLFYAVSSMFAMLLSFRLKNVSH